MGCSSSKPDDVQSSPGGEYNKKTTPVVTTPVVIPKSTRVKNGKPTTNTTIKKSSQVPDVEQIPEVVKPKSTYAEYAGSYDGKLATESECWLRGATFLSNGNIVVADYKNNKVKLFDDKFSFVSHLELPSGPWDVCPSSLTDTEIYTTIPYKKQVHMITIVYNTLSSVESFRTRGFCWGVASFAGGLAVSVKMSAEPGVPEFQVHLVDFDGTINKSITNDPSGNPFFLEPKFLNVTNDQSGLLVTDYKKNSVLCLNTEGGVVFTYSGMACPNGVATDDKNCIHVASFFGSERIHKLSAHGEKLDSLPPDEDRETLFPHCIAFRRRDRVIAVTTDTAMVIYELV